jgi:hypothetical protein
VNGEELQKITPETPLKVGDKVTVRMILNTDRPMEFIHIKDMRAAGFEPLDVLSGYQWKNNLGYYQSTKDASTNFYIEQMPKGKYVLSTITLPMHPEYSQTELPRFRIITRHR